MLLQACSKDQMMVNRIDGEWEIEQITFTKEGKDSVAMAPIGVFYFEKCKQAYGDCPGYYELEGNERVDIGFVMDMRNNQLNINLSSNPEIKFGGKYEIGSLSRKRLSITGDFSIEDEEVRTSYDIKMDLKKK
jgi:hypothetical protein